MLSPGQLRKLRYLSDTTIYPDAVNFIRRLVNEEDCATLPSSQVMGLLNIANAANYNELGKFIRHQRERNWPASKSSLKQFYTELEKLFTTLRKRVRDEFELLEQESNSRAAQQETDELMAVLARDFIQHLVAENGLLALEKAKAWARRK